MTTDPEDSSLGVAASLLAAGLTGGDTSAAGIARFGRVHLAEARAALAH